MITKDLLTFEDVTPCHVATQITNNHLKCQYLSLTPNSPDALFILSNKNQDLWHLINVKFDKDVEKRRQFRRITIGPDERLRTASERLAILDLASINPTLFGLPPLSIQERHDEAFDVESVTKALFRGV